MAIQKIQYTNKEQLVNDTTINDKYKCKADDLNEIKTVVNNNADEIPTISDEYGTSIKDGYSQNYINKNTINPSGEPSTSEEDVSSATFTNTLEAPMNIDLKGNTSQTGTPTPSSPIPINNVSGDNQIVVSDGGTDTTTYNIDLPVENLCNGINQNVWVSGSYDLVGVGTSNSGLIIATNGGKYTISTTKTQARYRVCCIDTLPTTQQSVTGYNGVLYDNTKRTITIDTSGHNYLAVDATDLTKIQVEQGTKANTYTPYGTTPIELNKIGTYQDYIYKENDKWYLHKEIGKYTFTGNENFTWDSDKQRIIIPISNLGINTPPLTTSQLFNIYNQKVIGTTFDNLYNKVVDNCIALSPGNSISIRSTGFDSLNTGKNTIANTDLHYILATPTNTEITYTPLIEQLESIKNAMSKEGTTNVNQVNNDAPFILDLSVFNDTYNGRYESLVAMINKLSQ